MVGEVKSKTISAFNQVEVEVEAELGKNLFDKTNKMKQIRQSILHEAYYKVKNKQRVQWARQDEYII